MSKNQISLNNISFCYSNSGGTDYESKIEIFREFNLNIPSSKVSVILGPSGCGKSTLLNIIQGILIPDSGVIEKYNTKNIAYIFQEPRVIPWETVGQNIDLVIKKEYSRHERHKIILHYLELTGLSKYINFYPSELSGGMLQRLSMARAFAYPSDIILMDEPFQSLDPRLKSNLTELFSSLWRKESRTAVFVTHDVREAVLLGDELFVLSASNPSILIEHLQNPIPEEKRLTDNPNLSQIENKLISLL